MKRKKTTSIVPLAVVLGAGALSAIVLAQNGKPTKSPNNAALKSKEEPAVVEVLRAERKPLEYYTGAVKSDLFSAPAPPAPKLEKVVIKTPEPVKIATPVEEIDVFADYAYSGTVTMGGESMALVENKKTREGQYLKVGESFMGAKVAMINDRSVSFDLVGGKSKMLAKTDDYTMTPLNTNAAFLDAKPVTPAAPGAPQMGVPNMGAMFGGGGRPDFRNMTQEQRDQMRQQFMQNMTPEQRERMQQRRMDRQFEGGRGGGRRGGFGGGFGG